MGTRLFINHTCYICGEEVQDIPDYELKKHPHEQNVEFVCTHMGRKQYFHTSCFEEMIAKQKEELTSR